jgi:hypothetical protein
MCACVCVRVSIYVFIYIHTSGLGPFVAPPQAQWAPTSLASPAHNMRRAEALEPTEWQAKAVTLLKSKVNQLVPAGGAAGHTQQQVHLICYQLTLN